MSISVSRGPRLLASGMLGTVMAAAPPMAAAGAPAATTHSLPGAGAAGVTVLRGPDPAYGCTGGGYTGLSTGWPGALYGAGYANHNQFGYHNCTLYSAYRLAANGLGNPGWSDNAGRRRLARATPGRSRSAATRRCSCAATGQCSPRTRSAPTAGPWRPSSRCRASPLKIRTCGTNV
jgi:hypothetical protein